ncbi:uncharacterized protein LOC135351185 [Halichondria panicea]|uniref:uncharacterized protein LOC135351185 n=1 Tax=Halichondria panicea TaxID=6063 RepID=UPI00312BC85D
MGKGKDTVEDNLLQLAETYPVVVTVAPPYPSLLASSSSSTEATPSNTRHRQISNVLVCSLITLLVMLCFGTPLTLVLTVPAYILADKAEVQTQLNNRRRAIKYRACSIALNMAAIVGGVTLTCALTTSILIHCSEFPGRCTLLNN